MIADCRSIFIWRAASLILGESGSGVCPGRSPLSARETDWEDDAVGPTTRNPCRFDSREGETNGVRSFG